MSTPWTDYDKLTSGISSTDTLMIYDDSAGLNLQLPIENAMATTTLPGFMSATDKTKLDGISEGATKTAASTTNGNVVIDDAETTVYTLPTATSSTLGGIKIGSYLSISSGKVSVNLSSLRSALRPTLISSFIVTSSASTSKSMSVTMTNYSEADIDLILVHGAGVTVTIGGVEVLDTATWSDVLASTDTVRLTCTLDCRTGIYIKNLVAAPTDASTNVMPVMSSGYLDSSTTNSRTITVNVTATSGYLQSGCEGELWAR